MKMSMVKRLIKDNKDSLEAILERDYKRNGEGENGILGEKEGRMECLLEEVRR